MQIINRYLDILLILACSFVLVLLIIIFPLDILRIIIGLPFVFFFPGYMLVAALFPSKNSISAIERMALSLGMSFAVVPLLGLILNYTPWGITLYSILITLSCFIIAMAIIVMMLRSRLPENSRFTFKLNTYFVKDLFLNTAHDSTSVTVGTTTAGAPGPTIKWLDSALSLSLVIAVTIAIGVVIYTITIPKVGEKFTEFYILGLDGKAQNYPKQIKPGESAQVLVGVVNHEQEGSSYRLIVSVDNVTTFEIPSILLNKEEKWERLVEFKPAKSGNNQKVGYYLYKDGSTDPYLILRLWINVND